MPPEDYISEGALEAYASFGEAPGHTDPVAPTRPRAVQGFVDKASPVSSSAAGRVVFGEGKPVIEEERKTLFSCWPVLDSFTNIPTLLERTSSQGSPDLFNDMCNNMTLLAIRHLGDIVAQVLLLVNLIQWPLIHTSLARLLLRLWRVVLNNNSNPGYLSKRQRQQRRLLAGVAFFYATPLVSAAFTASRVFRILSGVTASGSAVSIIPLRTLDGIPCYAWVISYGVWAVTITTYLTLQWRLIPSELKNRRQWYLFCVFILAVHFTVGISEKSTGVVDSFTVYGPLVLVASAYLISLVLGATTPWSEDTTTVSVLGLC